MGATDVIVGLVGEALTVIGAIVSVYLAAGIGVAFLEGGLASALGEPGVRAEVMRRIVLLVLCVAFVAFANVIAGEVRTMVSGMGETAVSVRGAVLRVGAYFVDILVGAAVVVMAVGVAFGFVDMQLNTIFGRPGGLSAAMARVAAVILLGVGGLLTIVVSHVVIRALGGE